MLAQTVVAHKQKPGKSVTRTPGSSTEALIIEAVAVTMSAKKRNTKTNT